MQKPAVAFVVLLVAVEILASSAGAAGPDPAPGEQLLWEKTGFADLSNVTRINGVTGGTCGGFPTTCVLTYGNDTWNTDGDADKFIDNNYVGGGNLVSARCCQQWGWEPSGIYWDDVQSPYLRVQLWNENNLSNYMMDSGDFKTDFEKTFSILITPDTLDSPNQTVYNDTLGGNESSQWVGTGLDDYAAFTMRTAYVVATSELVYEYRLQIQDEGGQLEFNQTYRMDPNFDYGYEWDYINLTIDLRTRTISSDIHGLAWDYPNYLGEHEFYSNQSGSWTNAGDGPFGESNANHVYVTSWGYGVRLEGVGIYYEPQYPTPAPSRRLTAQFHWRETPFGVQFVDDTTAAGGIQARVWDFGDGYGSSSPNPIHQYPCSGPYQVTLWDTDAAGNSISATKILEVETNGSLCRAVLRLGETAAAGVASVGWPAASSVGILVASSTMFAFDYEPRWRGQALVTRRQQLLLIVASCAMVFLFLGVARGVLVIAAASGFP